MATAEELLAAETGDNKVLTIDSDLRTISIPAGFGVFGVESDDDVLRVHFRGPRYYHDVDLSTFKLRVCVNNAKREEDAYEVKDMTIDGDDYITFSWLVGRFTAMYSGDIEFSLCFRELDSEGNVTREFNTTPATGRILRGLETGEAVVQKYPDIIEGVLLRLDSLEENGIPASTLDTTLTIEGKAADAKAVGDAVRGAKPLVVVLDPVTSTASHNSTQIIDYLNDGGSAVLKNPITSDNYADGGYIQLSGVTSGFVMFKAVEVFEDRTVQYLYTILDDANYRMTEVTVDNGISDEQAAQIQANAEAIAALPIEIADDGYTDITGIRQLTNFKAVKTDNTITLNYTLQGEKDYTDIIIIGDNGLPSNITTPTTSFDLTWEGF